ncbi:MAG: sigma-70 family RNA polymerase sigma factor [Ardenticatenaceae bacterium]|nr:sigma-70 family RNA polymerase sigma factor [Ardenticatenaceae bacterium]
MAELSDQELVARLQGGDKSACTICIDRYGTAVYRLALRLLKNEADAEDVMQETFLNAFKAIGSFEGRASIKTWLYRITYNNAMMRLRQKDPALLSLDETWAAEDGAVVVPQQLFDWCCLPERELTSEEAREKLATAVTDLPPALKGVFVLREFEGLSTQETADALEISTDLVKTRLYRARLQLRENLADYFAGAHASGA